MSLLAAGVDADLHVVTATSVVFVDVIPPMVTVVVQASSRIHEIIQRAGGFTVTLLTPEHADLAIRFAGRRRPTGSTQLDGLSWHIETSGAAVIDDVGPWVDCAVAKEVDLGHGSRNVLVIGLPLAAGGGDPRPGALVRQWGRYLAVDRRTHGEEVRAQ